MQNTHRESLKCSAIVYYLSGVHSALSLILTAITTLRVFWEEFEHVPVNRSSVKINVDKIFLMITIRFIMNFVRFAKYTVDLE